MRVLVLVLALGLSTIAAGCGGAPPAAAGSPAPAPAPVAAQEPARVPGSSPVIARAELDRVLDEGLGRFLQRVSTEADLREGRFVGFRVTELRDQVLFAGVDLRAGDTVVEVNGRGIERPEHAYGVWTSLRVASELTVVVLRGDERRELRFAILD